MLIESGAEVDCRDRKVTSSYVHAKYTGVCLRRSDIHQIVSFQFLYNTLPERPEKNKLGIVVSPNIKSFKGLFT